jgi:hypothetical protein
MKRTVFAISDYEGYFEELVMINNDQIIEFLGEDEETGVNSVKVIDDDVEDIWYYIDIIEIE